MAVTAPGVLTVFLALCKMLHMLNTINCYGNLMKKVRLFFFAGEETEAQRA